ncbi:MAG TPA: polysaccharide deacetylase family protein [Candidatus Krumholzibacteria bacterium]|nr:polysaccharide deacetylase family protein [Candidatus Krumholzibacteria bacterium]
MDPALAAGTAAAAAALLGASAHLGWRRYLGPPPPGLPAVLAYHKVGTPELGGTWCTRRQFAAHLDALRGAGVRGIDTDTFAARLEAVIAAHAATESAPRRAASEGGAASEVLLTFDDAFASFAEHAWPELQVRRHPVLLFVISDFVGQRARWDLPLPGRRRPHLDWPSLRALAAAGVEFGSHSAQHRDLRRLTDAALQQELAGSRQQLEDALGVGVRTVSYPFGRCDERVIAAAGAAGYRLGFAMCPPGPPAPPRPLALRRYGVYVIDPPSAVLDKVDPRRRLFWVQDLVTRGISAVAGLAAAASVARDRT